MSFYLWTVRNVWKSTEKKKWNLSHPTFMGIIPTLGIKEFSTHAFYNDTPLVLLLQIWQIVNPEMYI